MKASWARPLPCSAVPLAALKPWLRHWLCWRRCWVTGVAQFGSTPISSRDPEARPPHWKHRLSWTRWARVPLPSCYLSGGPRAGLRRRTIQVRGTQKEEVLANLHLNQNRKSMSSCCCCCFCCCYARLQLGYGASDGRAVQGVTSSGHLPSASRPVGTILQPDEVVAPAVRQVRASQPARKPPFQFS